MSMISLREHFHWRKKGSITSSLRSRKWINTVQAIVVPLNCSGNKARSINAFSLFCKPGHIWNRRVSTKNLIPPLRFLPIRSLFHSSRTRSTAIFESSGWYSTMASFVACSISKSNWLTNLAARIMRKASSLKRSSGLPTALINLLAKSSCPLKKSLIFPCRSIAMALIVKSRLFKSSCRLRTYSTFSGLRNFSYFDSVRKVVIS
ncbi:hypothetical protein SDC9_104281 [bioreactor metagenome]|uniref:Uncharacterized protein n=1 Tax=bioreactor metagenome TaxID=1076179 RepID=A0A645AWI0_9ZZZZ